VGVGDAEGVGGLSGSQLRVNIAMMFARAWAADPADWVSRTAAWSTSPSEETLSRECHSGVLSACPNTDPGTPRYEVT
jgi:hypothetical protein